MWIWIFDNIQLFQINLFPSFRHFLRRPLLLGCWSNFFQKLKENISSHTFLVFRGNRAIFILITNFQGLLSGIDLQENIILKILDLWIWVPINLFLLQSFSSFLCQDLLVLVYPSDKQRSSLCDCTTHFYPLSLRKFKYFQLFTIVKISYWRLDCVCVRNS